MALSASSPQLAEKVAETVLAYYRQAAAYLTTHLTAQELAHWVDHGDGGVAGP